MDNIINQSDVAYGGAKEVSKERKVNADNKEFGKAKRMPQNAKSVMRSAKKENEADKNLMHRHMEHR